MNSYITSAIYQTMNNIEHKTNFADGLKLLIEKYNIEDSIFKYNGRINEVQRGYFIESQEYDNLNDAIAGLNNFNQGIRIINNEKYIVGNIYNSLAELKQSIIEYIEYYNSYRIVSKLKISPIQYRNNYDNIYCNKG